MEYYCPCCGYRTLSEINNYDICRLCFWEDDPFQKEDPFSEGGANYVSLVQAKENYELFGACRNECIKFVSKPPIYPERDRLWKSYKEFVTEFFRQHINLIDPGVEAAFLSDEHEEIQRLRHIITALMSSDVTRARELCLKIAKSDALDTLWLYVYKELTNFNDEEIENLFVNFLVDNRDKYPDIEEIINEYFRESL
jgi:hypothetical protein